MLAIGVVHRPLYSLLRLPKSKLGTACMVHSMVCCWLAQAKSIAIRQYCGVSSDPLSKLWLVWIHTFLCARAVVVFGGWDRVVRAKWCSVYIGNAPLFMARSTQLDV